MRAFAETWPDEAIVQAALAQFGLHPAVAAVRIGDPL
jgi:hypothetical protein